MPKQGFIKIFYGILLALAICAGIYAIATPLVAQGGYFDKSLMEVLGNIMEDINELAGIADVPNP